MKIERKSSDKRRVKAGIRKTRINKYRHRRQRKPDLIIQIRRWFIDHSYGPAVCLAAVIILAAAVICIFALPTPNSVMAVEGEAIAAAQTEIPETGSDEANGSLYEGLQTSSTENTDSSVLYDESEDDASSVTVYAAEDAECYHLSDCKFAFASSKRLTPYEAYYLGFRPCGRCNPPVYDPQTGETK